MKAPSLPSAASTAWLPWVHSRRITWPISASTAVNCSRWPSTSPSPERTLPTAVTPGARPATAPAEIGTGEKLFCAVMA